MAHGPWDRLDLDQWFGTLDRSQIISQITEDRALASKVQRGLFGRRRKEDGPKQSQPPARPGYSFPGDPLKREDAIACARLLWPDVRYTDAFRKSKA